MKSSASFAAVCKHFCGSATDYGINLISKAVEGNLPLSGFCLVPCCRHRISIDQYTGLSYLNSIGIKSDAEFYGLKQIASWATCGAPVTATNPMEPVDEGENFKFWSYEKKLKLGRKAQAVVEFGRIKFLKENCGFECDLIEYVDVEFSPENLMIVGKRKN